MDKTPRGKEFLKDSLYEYAMYPSNLSGTYNPDRDKIRLNSRLKEGPPSIFYDVLGHETQHRQYDKTLKGENPRLSKERYKELLAGLYFDPWSGNKKDMYTPFQVGYSTWRPESDPYKIYAKHPELSNDYVSNINGLLANMAGLEMSLSKDEKLEDKPAFSATFPSSKEKEYYYRTSFPFREYLKGGPEENRPERYKMRDRAQNDVTQSRDSLKNKLLELLGF